MDGLTQGAQTTSRDAPAGDAPARRADYESSPLTRAEYIAAIVHLYRGELYRANMWRMRLDHTTNWAVITCAGLLTFTFREGKHSHWVLLIGLLLILVFHAFEARRYRFADVWRGRVRMIEENFYAPILTRDPVSPERDWGKLVAQDLFQPRFKITRLEALRQRFARNYWAIYLVLIVSWVAQVVATPPPAHSWADIQERLVTGFLPWWVPLAYVGTFLSAVALLVLLTPKPPGTEAEYWHSDSETPGEGEYEPDL